MCKDCDLPTLEGQMSGMSETRRVRCCASGFQRSRVVSHARKQVRERTCITTLRSAFPVRMSYNVNVRSEPILAKTDDSLRLKRIAVIVSVDDGYVRFDIGVRLS